MRWPSHLICVLVTILFQASALFGEAPAEFHVGKNIQGTNLNPYLEFFEDETHSYTIEQMLDPKTQVAFFRSSQKVLSFGFSKSTWWSRIVLQNPSQETRQVSILQHYPLLDEIEFHTVVDGRVVQHFLSGDMGQRQESDPVYRAPLFKTEVPPGGATVYIKARTKGTMNFEIFAYTESHFHSHHKKEYIFLYSMMSILVVMALYNFFIFLQLRKTVYIIYVTFLITMLFQPLSYSGLFIEIFPKLPFLVNEGYLINGNASSFLACLYPIYFLSLRGRHPWLMRICIFGMILPTLATFTAFAMDYEIAGKLAAASSLFASFATLTCGITCSLKRYRPAYFFTVAWSSLIFANGFRIFSALGVISPSFFSEWGALIGTVIEVILLSLGLSDKIRLTERLAFEKIEKLNVDLQTEHAAVVALNESLEQRVEEQTREVKSILRHIQMGILLAKGDSLSVTPVYSDYTKSIFHTQKVEGQDLVDFIFQGTRTNVEQRSLVRSVLNSCINEDAISTQLNLHALPHEIEYFHGEEKQLLQIDWNPVLNAEGIVEKMLVTVKDVTELKKLESDAAQKSQELAYIGEILDVLPAVFDRFIESSQKFLAENERLIKANTKHNPAALKILFINMHTIKGVARSLGLKHLTPLIHEAEQSLSAVMKKEKPWHQAQLLQEFRSVRDLLDFYQQLSQKKLGRDRLAYLSVPQSYAEKLNRFFGLIEINGSAELQLLARPLRQTIYDLILVRAETIFREVLSNADLLARDLNKEYPSIEIEDHDLFLTQQGQELIRHTFIHIVRNSMDHGIETAAERIGKGKSPEGRIRVSLEADSDTLTILYSDDGAGLNLSALYRLALDKGLVREQDQLSPVEKAYLIFEPGLSTCSVANDISGRGVGMSAVKEYVEGAGGSVQIKILSDFQGDFQNFMFEFKLPRTCFVMRDAEPSFEGKVAV